MRVISIDPGQMSGYTYADITDGKLKFCPFQMVDDVEDLWYRLKKFDPVYIVIESFEYRGGKNQRGVILFSKELIGVARLHQLITPGCERLFLQTAAQGKGYYTNPVLKQMGVYKPSLDHGMDATRHLLQWATFGFGYQFKADIVELVEMEYFNV